MDAEARKMPGEDSQGSELIEQVRRLWMNEEVAYCEKNLSLSREELVAYLEES